MAHLLRPSGQFLLSECPRTTPAPWVWLPHCANVTEQVNSDTWEVGSITMRVSLVNPPGQTTSYFIAYVGSNALLIITVPLSYYRL